jgi:hypothetical protein
METWSLSTLLICFGGGIVGAAFGGLWSIIFVGILVFAGCLIVIAGGSDFVLLQIGFGPIFGPQAGGFVSGAAAVCYSVGIKKNHPSGSAKDVLSPLVGTSWDVLAVGGIFGVFGWALQHVLLLIPIINQFDCIALTVALASLLARYLFLKEMPWGKPESIKQYGLLGTNNYAISWCGWQSPPLTIAVLGLGASIMSVAMAYGLKQLLDPMAAKGLISGAGAFLAPLTIGFAIALVNLVGLQLGSGSIQKVPVYHCQAIISALGFLVTGSFAAGVILGVLSGYLQELVARLTYNHASSHLDPPVTTIGIATFIINILFKAEFLNLGALFK